MSGYSIGKAVMGLRVVKQSDGQLAGIGANGLRWLLGIIDFGPCLLPGLITGLTTKGHRRIGDMAASTLVVDKSQVGVAPVVPGLTSPEVAPPAWTPPAPSSPQPDGSWAGAAPPAPPTADPARAPRLSTTGLTSVRGATDVPAADHATAHRDPTADHPTAHRDPTADHATAHRDPTADHATAHRDPTADHAAAHRDPTADHAAAHRDPTGCCPGGW